MENHKSPNITILSDCLIPPILINNQSVLKILLSIPKEIRVKRSMQKKITLFF